MKLSPEREATRAAELVSLSRAMAAQLMPQIERHTTGRTSEKILEASWPTDARAALLMRTLFAPRYKSAVSPLKTTDATAPPPRKVVEMLAALAPASGALALLSRGVHLSLVGLNYISIPIPPPLYDAAGNLVAPTAAFVAEGDPGNFIDPHVSAVQLGPSSKLLVLSGVSEELQSASPGNVAALIGTMVSSRVTATLDKVFFSSSAASGATPAGILAGVTPLAAATATGNAVDAMAADMAAIVQAIARYGHDTSEIVFVCAPGDATRIAAHLPDADVIASSGVPTKTLIGVAVKGLYSGYQDLPQIDTAKSVSLHEDTTTPLPIVSASPSTVAAPQRSFFQTASLAIRCRCEMAFVAAPGAVQVVNTVNW
jgi:hypothetical protein